MVFYNLLVVTTSYVAFSDKIQFAEAPDIGSEFIGYYVGKLRQLDDISLSLTH